jgi:hypothetical protein
VSEAITMRMPEHARLVAEAPEGLDTLDARLRAAGGKSEMPVRTIFKLGRDLAEALTALQLVGLSAGQLDAKSVYVDAELTEARLAPRLPAEGAPADTITTTICRDAQRSDLERLGALMFELCCGRAPGSSDLRHMRRGYGIVSLNNPRVPAEGDAVIARLLGVTRTGYVRAKEALDDLRRIVVAIDRADAGEDVAAPSTSLIGKKVEELFAGWRSTSAKTLVSTSIAAPTSSPGLRGLHRVLIALIAALLVLRVCAPVPVAANVAPKHAPPARTPRSVPAGAIAVKLAIAARAAARQPADPRTAAARLTLLEDIRARHGELAGGLLAATRLAALRAELARDPVVASARIQVLLADAAAQLVHQGAGR